MTPHNITKRIDFHYPLHNKLLTQFHINDSLTKLWSNLDNINIEQYIQIQFKVHFLWIRRY